MLLCAAKNSTIMTLTGFWFHGVAKHNVDCCAQVRYIAIDAGPELRRRSARELTSELVNFESYNLGAKVNK